MPITTDELRKALGGRLGNGPPANYVPLPDITPTLLPIKPKSEITREEDSARILVRNLQARVNAWSELLPVDAQVAMYAMLANGEHIRVSRITAEGQNGIVIESEEDLCILLLHQTSLQLFCYGEQVEDPSKRHPIGFLWTAPLPQEDPQ